ncbi:MAG: polyprenyl synthetase family protein [Candidatus Bathyarchaeota archaeon]|nr:polyprenyl synthetase family protein [Candidatus Bathyarchaeota archaeon]
MSWEKTLDQYGELIEAQLKQFLDETIQNAKEYHPFIENVYNDLAEYILRKGKRLASTSTLLVYKGYTGKIDERILQVCVGIELYRHAILIHDDLVDMDKTRRGGPTLHTKFINSYNPYNERFGDGTSVFTGNIAYALATRAIMTSGFSMDALEKVLLLTFEGYRAVNESQILDLLFEFKDVTVEEWTAMAGNRASSLFQVTLLTGALLGNAPETDLDTLTNAAENMGFSFDIQDDIIDSFAPKEEYGRSPCLDISKNKKPLHVIYALNSKDPSKSQALKCLLGKQFLNFGEVDLARKLLRESGGLDAAKAVSKKHAQQAKAYINQTSLDSEVKEFFSSFITYIEDSLEWYK